MAKFIMSILAGALLCAFSYADENVNPVNNAKLSQQNQKEIAELQANANREDSLLRQQEDAIDQLKSVVARQQKDLDTARQQYGAGSLPVQEATSRLNASRTNLMLTISKKDHTLYRLGILKRGIVERRSVVEKPS